RCVICCGCHASAGAFCILVRIAFSHVAIDLTVLVSIFRCCTPVCNKSVINQTLSQDFTIIDCNYFTGKILLCLVASTSSQDCILWSGKAYGLVQRRCPWCYFYYFWSIGTRCCICPGAIYNSFAYRCRVLAVGVVVGNDHNIGVLGRNAPHERTFCCITLAGGAKDDNSTSGIVALGTCMVYRFERLGQPVWV